MLIKKKQLEMDAEQLTGSKLRMEYDKTIYCHLAYLTLCAEYITQNARLDESQAKSTLLGEVSTTSDKQMIPL